MFGTQFANILPSKRRREDACIHKDSDLPRLSTLSASLLARTCSRRVYYRALCPASFTRLCGLIHRLKGEYMSKLIDKLVASMVAVILPRVIVEMVKGIEELVRADLNNDGVIGFGDKPDA